MGEMKFEIDLNDIFSDEYGSETIQESVRRQVVEKMTEVVSKGVAKKIDIVINEAITKELESALKEKMPLLIDDLMNTEYAMVDRWGDVGSKTTFRKELIKSIQDQMKYTPKNYDSDKNNFTRSVDATVKETMQQFASDYKQTVDKLFTQEALNYAQNSLKQKLGIEKGK